MSNTQKSTTLPQVFDASQVAPQQPMEALPPGFYNVVITDGEVKPGSNGTGIRMELEWTVLDGAFKGRKVWDGLNIENASAKAQEIAQQQLSAICHSTGVIRVVDVQEFFNKPHQIKVDVEAGRFVDANNNLLDPQPPAGSPVPMGCKYYEPRNRFRGAKAIGTGAPAATSAGPAPSWAKAPGAAATPPPAAAAPATPPWAAKPGAAAAPAATTPPPAATTAAPAAGKAPAGPKGPKAAKKAERKFHVFMPDGTVSPPKPESEVAAMLAQGMPAETMVNLEGGGDDDWKPAAEMGIVAPAAPAPAASTPAGAPVAPPWARG